MKYIPWKLKFNKVDAGCNIFFKSWLAMKVLKLFSEVLIAGLKKIQILQCTNIHFI